MRSRRTYLKGSGVALAFVLAGCSDTESAGDESAEDEGTEQEEAPAEEPEPEDASDDDAEDDTDYEEIDRGDLEALTRAAVDEALEESDTAPEVEGTNSGDETADEDPDRADDETDGAVDEGGDEADFEEDEATDDDREGSETADESEQGTDEQEMSDEQDANESDETTGNEGEPTLDGTVYAQVDYDGEWVFAYSTPNRTSSFDRSDRQTIEIDTGLDVVSVAVQKADDSNEELATLILIDGQIVADATTTDSFGIAHATHSID